MTTESAKFIELPSGEARSAEFGTHFNLCRAESRPFVEVRFRPDKRTAVVLWTCGSLSREQIDFLDANERAFQQVQDSLIGTYTALTGDITPFNKLGPDGWLDCLPLAIARIAAGLIHDLFLLAIEAAKSE